MASTSVEIVNDALARLGVSPIVSLTDGTKQAQFANRFYSQTLDEVLAARQWPFALQRSTLTRVANTAGSEWSGRFTLPADYLRLVQINNDEISTIRHKYAIEASAIQSDETTMFIVYVARVTTVTMYSPLFVEAMSIKLASKLCGPLTGSMKMAVEFLSLYEKTLSIPEVGEQTERSRRAKESTLNATEIVNSALALLGVSPISALTDESVQAQMADRLYEQTRDAVLAERNWPFALKRATLTRTATAAGSEWASSFTLPADNLRLVQINKEEVDTVQHKYSVEGNKLLTDATTMEVCYVAKTTDTTLYTPVFVEALVFKLASKMVAPLVPNASSSLLSTLITSYEKSVASPQIGEQRKRTNRTKPATITDAEIANNALCLLGVSPINSLSDVSVQAQLADRLYSSTRDEVLLSHLWNFAMKRATLTATTAPTSGWSYAYTLPADCLRVVQLNGFEANETQDEHAVEGGVLVTDAATAAVRYLARITDTTAYPPLFLEALALKLAAKMAGSLTQDRTLSAELTDRYERLVIPKGRLLSVFQTHPKTSSIYSSSKLVAARSGGL
jgi:tryptophan-rich sensory protein